MIFFLHDCIPFFHDVLMNVFFIKKNEENVCHVTDKQIKTLNYLINYHLE